MSDMLRERDRTAPAGFRLGDPIALEDLLALPPDGRRYARDDEGRLILMCPDDADRHGWPLSRLVQLLGRTLELERWSVLPERGIAFEQIMSLAGCPLPESRLGRKALEPDVAVYAGRPRSLPWRTRRPGGRRTGHTLFAPEGLQLVIELLSPGTAHADVGRERPRKADDVDRWRTYLVNRVPEYWILNAWPEPIRGLPGRSGLFLRQVDGRWAALAEDGVVLAGAAVVEGVPAVSSGVVRSAAVPDLAFDVGAFWDVVGDIKETPPL